MNFNPSWSGLWMVGKKMKSGKFEHKILAGDIGGTKTNLGIFSPGNRRPLPIVVESFPSQESSDLATIIERFFKKHPVVVHSACFGIAGPVVQGKSKPTNLPWEISEVSLKRRFGWQHVYLLNDLAATAEMIPLLTRREQFALNSAKPPRNQNLALVAPGTGLGEALLIFQDGKSTHIASEGGHVDFAPQNDVEVRLWRYLQKKFGHVSVERILSGPGLVNVYEWLRDSEGYGEPGWLKKRFEEEDPARVITETGLAHGHRLCVETLNVFVTILGATAGNLALTSMTTGGVYLGGGIPPKILPALKGDPFMKAFTNKGRFEGLMKRIPVRVILNDKAALIGAAQSCLRCSAT